MILYLYALASRIFSTLLFTIGLYLEPVVAGLIGWSFGFDGPPCKKTLFINNINSCYNYDRSYDLITRIMYSCIRRNHKKIIVLKWIGRKLDKWVKFWFMKILLNCSKDVNPCLNQNDDFMNGFYNFIAFILYMYNLLF